MKEQKLTYKGEKRPRREDKSESKRRRKEMRKRGKKGSIEERTSTV